MCEIQCGLSTLPANTKRWPNADPPSVTLAQHPTSPVCAGLRSIAAGLVLLTAGGNNKPTPMQCLLNVGPASPVLTSNYSAPVSTICWRERVHIQGGVLLQTVKWKYLLISQVCIYRLLEGRWQALLQTTKCKYLLISKVCTYRLLEGLWQAKESAVTPARRKYIYTEMNGTHRLTESHRNTERTEVNQHVPTSLYSGETQ